MVAPVIQRARSEARERANICGGCDPSRGFLDLLFGIVDVALGDVLSGWKRLVRARSVQSNAAVDDELSTGNIAGFLRQKESGGPRHLIGRAPPLQ